MVTGGLLLACAGSGLAGPGPARSSRTERAQGRPSPTGQGKRSDKKDPGLPTASRGPRDPRNSISAGGAESAATTPAPDGGATSGTRRIHILLHTDLGGHFSRSGCGHTGRNSKAQADYANLLSAISTLRRRIAKEGGAPPLVLSSGNHLGPDIFGQFFSGEKSRGISLLVGLLQAAGYDAVLLARHDLSCPPGRRYARAMARAHIPLLKGNLTCADKSDPRCRQAADRDKPYFLVQRGGLKIAIVGLLPDDLGTVLGPRRKRGLGVRESRTWLIKALKRIRRKHLADLVVLLSDLDSPYSAPKRILDLLRRLGPLAPDVTVSNALYDSPSGPGAVTVVRRSDGKLVVSAGRFGELLGHLVVEVRGGPKGPLVETVRTETIHTAGFAPKQPQETRLRRMMERLCRKLDVPLGHGTLKHPMSRAQFIRYSLEVIRRRTHAELAILPDSLFSEAGFPLTGTMTKEKIRRAIRTRDRVGMMVVKGSWLKRYLTKYLSGDRPRLWVAGLTKEGKLYYINGRVLQPDIHYGVATTDFVAQGGEGLVPKPRIFLKKKPYVPLRQALEIFFARDRFRRTKSDRFIDLESNFIPLRDKFLLFTTMDMNLALTDVSILHPGLYTDQPQLNRERLTGLTVNASVMGQAENSNHSIKGTLSLKYGKARTWVTNELTGIDEKTTLETDDLVTLSFLYKYKRLHSRYDPKRWFYPVPFLETYVETELTKDLVAKSGKVYRYAETAGIAGVGFRLYPKLFVKLGFVSRSYNLLVPEERLAERGLYLGMDLDRTALVAKARYKLYWESNLDVVFVRMTTTRVKELVWTNKLAFAFIDHLFFTINHEFYLYDTAQARFNMASNLTAGIQVLLDLRHQLN